MNIMDGMDAARFRSGNAATHNQTKREKKQEDDKPPMVIRNLNNQ